MSSPTIAATWRIPADARNGWPYRCRPPAPLLPLHLLPLQFQPLYMLHLPLLPLLLLLLLLFMPPTCLAAANVAVPAQAAVVEQPRPYGYTIGDLLRQRIALGTPAAPFPLAELPRLGRLGSSLWRRRSEREIDASGQHWLLLEYQLINTPQSLTVWYLPSLKLRPQTGRAVINVASAPFTITPFTPPQPFELALLPAVLPDQPAAPVALAPFEERIRMASAALIVVVVLWAAGAGWRYRRRGRHLPFARAVRDLRALAADDPLAAQRRLHHALNDSAGEVVRPATLSRLLALAPHFGTERVALERFLHDSQAAFFGGQPTVDIAPIGALARRLRKLEQRHAR